MDRLKALGLYLYDTAYAYRWQLLLVLIGVAIGLYL